MATPNLGFQNFFTTTLASGITASDTTIYLNSLPTPSEGYLVIEPDSSTNKEIIYYTSKGANFVTLPSVAAGRGVGGTTAVSHSSGVTVQMNVVAEHFEALQDGTAFAVGGIGASAYADGWTPILGSTPNTVTYNGNRNYDLVFNSVDLSSTISPGQKLKLTRTVAAPTQCTDLESGSSQYFTKSSPAGVTFTDDWSASAWIKLESYTGSRQVIINKSDYTNQGFGLAIDSSGRIEVASFRIAGNNSVTTSYASVPLNKWVHVAATTDLSGASVLVYIDGVLVPSLTTVTGTITALVQYSGDLRIGALSSSASQYFDGKLAQVALFSSVLSATTIRSYASQGLSGSESTLISAYSFNNSINDLNTTNANNLTASGSAVATNADSPFANAVTAGLQEYAEINSVTFSTNTTVNVRVPETCMIPTSGGISNTYYAVGVNPYGLPAFTNIIAEVLMPATFSTASTSATQLSGGTLTVTIPTNKKVRVTAYARRMTNTTSNTDNVLAIYVGSIAAANLISEYVVPYPSTGGTSVGNSIQMSKVFQTASSANQTFILASYTSGGTMSVQSGGNYPTSLTVEII